MGKEELKKGDEVVATNWSGNPKYRGIVVGVTATNVIVEKKCVFGKKKYLVNRGCVEKITF